jgi:DNA-binding NarL/FixJ family response regulator
MRSGAVLFVVVAIGDGAMTRVLLVEDHAMFRQAFSLLLDRQPDMEVVAQAGSLAEARQKLGGVDVVVLDIALPDGDGIELISELRVLNSNASVLVLSATLNPEDPERVFEAGADAILQKVHAPLQIIDEIRRIREIG